MKCPACDGKKTILVGRWNSIRTTCDKCHGTSHIEATNEEWLKSLDTEELVDYLFEVHKGGSSVERQRWIEEHKERIKMQIRGWLKEKHNG